MTEMLVILVLQLWHLWRHQGILDLRVWILGNFVGSCASSMRQIYWELPYMEQQFPKRPLTWTTGRPLREAIHYPLVIAPGLLLVEQAVSISLPTATTAIYSQAFCLYVLVVKHGLKGLLNSGPRFWTKKITRRHMAAYAGLNLVLTCLCTVGWLMPGSQPSLPVCLWVWIIAIADVAGLWMIRYWVTRTGSYIFAEDLQPIWPTYLAPNELI